MLLVHPVVELGRALPVLIGLVFAGGDHTSPVPSLVAALAVTALAIARWFTTQLRITPEQVELRTGVLRRRNLATRRDRIRTVDVTSHLLHRALGLARVVVGTGTSDRKGRDRLVLDGLTAVAAAQLRDALLNHRVDAPAATAPVVDRPDELVRLDHRWVWLAPFTLSGAVTGLVVWGFFWRLQGDGVDVLHSGPLRAVTHDAEHRSTAAVVVAVAVLLVVFVSVTSLLGYVLAFWRFRLVRHPGGTLEVTRGLLTTRSTSIERRRLVGVRVSEPLLLRAVGGARLLAVATGLRVGRGAERGGEALLPPAPRAVALAVGRDVLDGTTALDTPLSAHGPAARRRRLVRSLAGAVALLAVAVAGWATGGSAWPVWVAVLLVVAAAPLARDRYRSLGHAVRDGYLAVGAGSIVRRRTLLHGDAIIGWNLRRSVFQRRSGLATLVATTAAGRQGEVVSDVPLDEALAVADGLTPGLLSQFRAPYCAVWSDS
ncbi:MAG: PH domain-containing protein [Jatrophihabitans endophyticus]|nr:PH domain-containing protein [Jatrophihabitans endophyticus]